MAVITRPEAPLTLGGEPPAALGLLDQLGLWGNLGVSLLLPVAATFLLVPGQSLLATLTAVVVGSIIGCLMLGLGALPGTEQRVPAMVLLRGLLGRRLSYLPTALNLLQCVGWATFEIVIIGEAATRLTSSGLRPLWVVLAGVVATLMALRPLGSVRLLRRYAAWAVAASTVYLFVEVLRQPLPSLTQGTWTGFWTSADIVIALPVSWIPLAADYTRFARNRRAGFVGPVVGYATTSILFFGLGVFALAAYRLQPGFDVIDALLALPVGGLALLFLVVDEIDEAFANLHSTAISAQNVVPHLDRRLAAVVVGALATVLALSFDIVSYEPFLFLLGAVFVPLSATLAVDYFLLRRGVWDTSERAPARWLMLLPWVAGFVAYQLTTPTLFDGAGAVWTGGWSDLQGALGIPAANGLSASLVSFSVASILAAVCGLASRVRLTR